MGRAESLAMGLFRISTLSGSVALGGSGLEGASIGLEGFSNPGFLPTGGGGGVFFAARVGVDFSASNSEIGIYAHTHKNTLKKIN